MKYNTTYNVKLFLLVILLILSKNIFAEPQVLNVADPGENGISYNKIEGDFDVDTKGLILNNEPAFAKTIILEVTGKRSELIGEVKIVGPKAKFIFVNPNGITCDGFSFVNSQSVNSDDEVELSTHKLQQVPGGNFKWEINFAGDIEVVSDGIEVKNGSITLRSLKINASGVLTAKNILKCELVPGLIPGSKVQRQAKHFTILFHATDAPDNAMCGDDFMDVKNYNTISNVEKNKLVEVALNDTRILKIYDPLHEDINDILTRVFDKVPQDCVVTIVFSAHGCCPSSEKEVFKICLLREAGKVGCVISADELFGAVNKVNKKNNPVLVLPMSCFAGQSMVHREFTGKGAILVTNVGRKYASYREYSSKLLDKTNKLKKYNLLNWIYDCILHGVYFDIAMNDLNGVPVVFHGINHIKGKTTLAELCGFVPKQPNEDIKVTLKRVSEQMKEKYNNIVNEIPEEILKKYWYSSKQDALNAFVEEDFLLTENDFRKYLISLCSFMLSKTKALFHSDFGNFTVFTDGKDGVALLHSNDPEVKEFRNWMKNFIGIDPADNVGRRLLDVNTFEYFFTATRDEIQALNSSAVGQLSDPCLRYLLYIGMDNKISAQQIQALSSSDAGQLDQDKYRYLVCMARDNKINVQQIQALISSDARQLSQHYYEYFVTMARDNKINVQQIQALISSDARQLSKDRYENIIGLAIEHKIDARQIQALSSPDARQLSHPCYKYLVGTVRDSKIDAQKIQVLSSPDARQLSESKFLDIVIFADEGMSANKIQKKIKKMLEKKKEKEKEKKKKAKEKEKKKKEKEKEKKKK